MNEYFQENRRSLFILLGLLLIFAVVLFFILLRPQMKELSTKEREVQALGEEIESLKAELEKVQDVPDEKDLEELLLMNKIPQEKELDDLLIWFEKIEVETDMKIEHISFTYDSNVEVEETEEEETETVHTLEDQLEEHQPLEVEEENEKPEEEAKQQTKENEASETNEIENEQENETDMDPALISEIPEGLEVFVIQISGHSKEFADLIQFLEAIEREERISFVSSLTFEQPTEEEQLFAENPHIAISFEAELTTFYYSE